MFGNTYQNKKVLITGHTGFKGSWLTTWLLNLGADVIGISKDIPTKPSMFEELGLEKRIQHYLTDIRNFDNLSKIINQVKPDFVFHLAAQAIVSTSYNDPLETISSKSKINELYFSRLIFFIMTTFRLYKRIDDLLIFTAYI